MLIDDAPFNLIPLEGILLFRGIQVTKFENGFDAIRCFQRRLSNTCCRSVYRLVLTDIQMPEMDGYKVAELIAASQKYWRTAIKSSSVESYTKSRRECPIVAVTAHCDDSVKLKATSCGIKRVIPKPVDVEMIDSVLKDFYHR